MRVVKEAQIPSLAQDLSRAYHAAMTGSSALPVRGIREDVSLAILHAPPAARPALTALFALDDRLAQVVRTTREPVVGQMRLAWWREALARLDTMPPPAEPVLVALAADALVRGVAGAALAGLTDGWEELVASEGTVDLDAYARRGAVLFAAAAQVLAGDVPAGAGEGWALADLSRHLSDPVLARAAAAMATARFETAFASRWERTARPVGMLALLARFELDDARPAARAVRSLRFRMTGR